jgi:ribosomal-protein-alanine N-acetyltransferase
MSELTINRLVPEDAQACATLQESVAASGWDAVSFPAMLEADRILGGKAVLDGELKACVLGQMAADELEILTLVVDEGNRRKGIARDLLDWLVEEAKEEYLSTIFLEVRASNKPARKLYKSFGFQEVGKRRNYYIKPKEDGLILKRSLLEG